MSQPEESRTKTTSTDAVLTHPHNAPDLDTDQMSPPQGGTGQTRVEIDGAMVPLDADGRPTTVTEDDGSGMAGGSSGGSGGGSGMPGHPDAAE